MIPRRAVLAALGAIVTLGVISAATLRASGSDAADLWPPVLHLEPADNDATRMIIGVGVHREFTGFDAARSDELVRQMGFTSIRDELGQSSGNAPGGLNRSLAKGGLLSSPLRSTNDNNLFTVSGGGSAQYPSGIPLTAKDRRSFYGFLADLGPRMSASSPLIEIWNEWNLPTRLRKAGSPASYSALVEGAVPVLRKAFPKSTIIVGGVGNDFTTGIGSTSYWDWTGEYLDGGTWKQADALSVHLYANCMRGAGRQPAAMIGRLMNLDRMIRARNAGRSFPVYLTEVGWPAKRGSCGFDESERAAFAAQFLIMAEAVPFVKGVWLYELRDSAGVHTDMETTFGLASSNYIPKPSACPAMETIALLKSYRVTAVDIVNGVANASLKSDRKAISVVWSADGAAHTIPLGPNRHARSLCSSAQLRGDTLELGILPKIVSPALPNGSAPQ